MAEQRTPLLAGPFVIASDDACLDGHFPGNPLVPGVVVLDLAALALEKARTAPVEIAGVSRVKFTSPLRPGELLMIECEAAQDPTSARFRCVSGERLIAEGVFLLRATPTQ